MNGRRTLRRAFSLPADRRSRRSALRGIGAGGLAAGLLAALGVERAPAASGSCALTIFAKTSAGPHKNKTYSGTLNLQIGENGAIDQGNFTTDDGQSHPLVGQATGRALSLRITMAQNTVMELNGTADIDLLLCRAPRRARSADRATPISGPGAPEPAVRPAHPPTLPGAGPNSGGSGGRGSTSSLPDRQTWDQAAAQPGRLDRRRRRRGRHGLPERRGLQRRLLRAGAGVDSRQHGLQRRRV